MKKMFALLLLAAALAMPQPALAVPALEHSVTRTQPDGSVVTLKQRGDEFAHWLEDTEGHAIVKTKEGRFEFALPDGAGGLKASGKLCGTNVAAPDGAVKDFKPATSRLRLMMENNLYEQPLASRGSAAQAAFTGWHSRPAEGEKNLMIIRVNFVDTPLVASEDFHMQKVWKEGDDTLSVRRYYTEQSHGKISVVSADYQGSTGGPFGMITVSLDASCFNGGKHPDRLIGLDVNTIKEQVSVHANEVALITDIIEEAATAASVDFAEFDTNNNGKIEPSELCIYMIMGGYEESYSAYINANYPMIWAHAWGSWTPEDIEEIKKDVPDILLADHEVTIAGKTVTDWAMNGELCYESENKYSFLPCVGTITHELGHQMCRLPDLYDVSGINTGMDVYSNMAAGSWGAKGKEETAGSRPVNLDAWSRIYLGWESPKQTVTASESRINLSFSKALTANGIIRIESPAADSSTEYILAEVRDPVKDKWDMGIQRGGKYDLAALNSGALLLVHVDENVGSGALEKGNNINTSAKPHQGVMPIAVDCNYRTGRVRSATNLWYEGNPYLEKLNGDVASFSAGRTYFYGDPQAYSASIRSGIALEEISAPGDTMTAVLLYNAGSGSNPASPAKTELDYDTAAAITLRCPLTIFTVNDAIKILSTANTDLNSGDMRLDDAHQVTLTETAVMAAAGANKITAVYPLPLFAVMQSSSSYKQRIACSFVVASADLMAERPEDVKLLKVTGKSSSKYFTYTDNSDDFVRDGYFTIQPNDDSGSVVPKGTALTENYYRVTLFAKDNGAFDLDKTEGVTLDPAAIVSTPKSSSGGCNAGFAALLAIPALAVFRRRKRQ